MRLAGVVLVAVTALGIGGAGGFYGSELYRSRQLSEAAATAAEPENRARFYLEQVVIDPASIQLRDVSARGEALCGEVNARNRMGGYVGFRRFVVTPGLAIEIDYGDEPAPHHRAENYTERMVRRMAFDEEFPRYCGSPQPLP